MEKHEVVKMRREPVRRTLHVADKEYLTPHMLRIVFSSADLEGFDSPSPDDHIKLFLPAIGTDGPVMRDFTPRAWDIETGSFTIDFALHPQGVASDWAKQAAAGDTLQIGGPKGSTIVPDDFDWYLLIGDASAFPSIGRRLRSFRKGVPVRVVALAAGAEERYNFETESNCRIDWLEQTANSAEDAEQVARALRQSAWPQGEGFVWIAGEAAFTRATYVEITERHQHPKEWIKAAAYWTSS